LLVVLKEHIILHTEALQDHATVSGDGERTTVKDCQC